MIIEETSPLILHNEIKCWHNKGVIGELLINVKNEYLFCVLIAKAAMAGHFTFVILI